MTGDKTRAEDPTQKVLPVYEDRAREGFRDDPTNRWDHLFSKLTTDHLLLSQIDIQDKRVLNIGCAQPRDEIAFAGKVRAWTTVDFSEGIIRASRRIVNEELNPRLSQKIKFQVADATSLPFREGQFDVVVAFSTIDHIPSGAGRTRAIQEMSRVVKKGGHVIITVPNKLNLAYYLWVWSKQHGGGLSQGGYEYCFFPWELKRLMVRAGLRPLRFASNFVIPLGIWMKPTKPLWLAVEYFGFRMGYLARKPG